MRRREGCARLLRWYPATWRDRYGDEFVACMEDELDGARPTVAFRASVATAGMRERARSVVQGPRGDAADRVRSGALVVLGAWTVLVFAGAVFAKGAEHFTQVQPPAAQTVARAAYVAVAALAAAGGVLVAAGAACALPATVRFLRGGGWPAVRGRVVAAAGATLVVAVATFALVRWAHHLDVRQRNGGDTAYAAAVLVWAGAVAAALGLWAAGVVAVGRRIDLTGRVLRAEGALAVLVAASMVGVTAAVGVWWAAMAEGAPWFLAGTRPGTGPSPVPPALVVVGGLLVVATAVAARGSWRVAAALRR